MTPAPTFDPTCTAGNRHVQRQKLAGPRGQLVPLWHRFPCPIADHLSLHCFTGGSMRVLEGRPKAEARLISGRVAHQAAKVVRHLLWLLGSGEMATTWHPGEST